MRRARTGKVHTQVCTCIGSGPPIRGHSAGAPLFVRKQRVPLASMLAQQPAIMQRRRHCLNLSQVRSGQGRLVRIQSLVRGGPVLMPSPAKRPRPCMRTHPRATSARCTCSAGLAQALGLSTSTRARELTPGGPNLQVAGSGQSSCSRRPSSCSNPWGPAPPTTPARRSACR